MTAEAQLCASAVVAQFAMRAVTPSISRPSTATGTLVLVEGAGV
ncbi:hypothetical protein ACI0ZS_001385 [Cronobacter turicensis]